MRHQATRTAPWLAFSMLSCALSIAACGASQSTSTSTSTSSDPAANPSPGGLEDTSTGSEEKPGTLPDGKKSPISYMNFTSDGVLQLGTIDGKTALVSVMSRKAQTYTPAAGYRIEAISNDGAYTVIHSTPPRVVGNDGTLILNMNMLTRIESARFSPDVFSMFVTEPSGKLRVWGQAHSFEKQGDDETLASYLNRQGSDFTVEFEPLSGPMFTMPDGGILVGNTQGVVSFWSSNAPGRTAQVMKVDGPLRALSASGTDIVAVSKSGSLKVGQIDPPSYHAWSRQAKTEWAATNHVMRGEFVDLSNGTLKLRETQTGEVKWEKPLPAGQSCGLVVSTDGRMGAACIDGVVMVFYTRDGKWDSLSWFADVFHWTDPNGVKIY